MGEQNILYAILLFIATLVAIVCLSFIYPRRKTVGAIPLMGLMLGLAMWTSLYAIFWLIEDPQLRQTWLDLPVFAVELVPVCFLLFAIYYTGRSHWVSKRLLFLLSIIPILTIIFILLENQLGLLYGDLNRVGLTYHTEGQAWFWINVIYSHVLIAFGIVLLIRYLIHSQQIFRAQTFLILTGVSIPWIINILMFIRENPRGQLDLTPLSFLATGTLFTISLLRGQMMDIMPIARRLLLEHMDDGVVVLDTKNRIIDINPAALAVLSPDNSQVIGKRMGDIAPQYIDTFERFLDAFDTHQEVQVDTTPPRYYDVYIKPLKNHNGQLLGRLITWYDITDDRQAESEKQGLIDDLNNYAHTIAHDLKNPVGLIIGYSSLMLDPSMTESPDDIGLWATEIKHTSEKMHSMIEELLLLSSVRTVDEVNISVVDMKFVVPEALRRLSYIINESGADIITTDSWIPVIGYAPWIEEIWANYISNAIKYGGQPPHLELGNTLQDNGFVRFWVRDNGAGLTSEQQAKLFHEFERLEKIRVDGHGLGLSIVKKIITKLNGEVGVESDGDNGSTFYFTLPAQSKD